MIQRVANVQRGHLDLSELSEIEATEDEVADLLLKPGDILLNEGGDRDKLGRGWIWSGEVSECIHQNHVFRARPVLPDVKSKYVSHYANHFGQSFFIDQGKQTTNLASVSMSRVRRFPVALPSSAEQAAILDELEGYFQRCSLTADVVRGAFASLGRLASSILSKAFRGELVPQDPNDVTATLTDARTTRDVPAPAQTKKAPSSGRRVRR